MIPSQEGLKFEARYFLRKKDVFFSFFEVETFAGCMVQISQSVAFSVVG